MNSEIISIIANLALAVSVIVALVFGIAQVRAAAQDRHERLTIEVLRNFQTREFAELTLYVISHDLPSSGPEMMSLPANEQIIIFQFSQQMESIGMLVAERLISIDLVDKTLGSLVATAWEKYKPMFLEIRENQPDPFLGEYFQWLAEQINIRMQEHPRKPFHETNAIPGMKYYKIGRTSFGLMGVHRPK